MEKDAQKYDSKFRELHHLTSSVGMSFDRKIEQLLQLGLDTFCLDIGILSKITDDTYTVISVISSNNDINKGDIYALSDTYCSITLENDSPTYKLNAGESGWKSHPCYINTRLETYLGTPVYLQGKIYGTLNFSSPHPHTKDFQSTDFEFLQLMAQWISFELDSQKKEEYLRDKNFLLAAIGRANESYIINAEPQSTFSEILESLLILTESECGFIGEINHTNSEHPCLKTHAVKNITWNEEIKSNFNDSATDGIKFENMAILFRTTIETGQTAISNDPQTDLIKKGIPKGHSSLNSFISIPIHLGKEFIGMIGLANRPKGYKEDLLFFLDPLLTTCSNIIYAHRESKKRTKVESELIQFKSTLDQTLDCVFMFTPDDLKFFYVNHGAISQFGYTQTELMTMGPVDIKPNVNLAAFKKLIAPLLNREINAITFETIHEHKEGHHIPVEILLQYIAPEDENPRFVAIVRDITERNRIDKLKSEFISTVSHELRTPLTSIYGSLGLLEGSFSSSLNDQAQSLINVAHRNAKRLISLINDILDMDKIVSGNMSFDMSDHSLSTLLAQSIEGNRGYADKYKVSLELINETNDIKINVDPERFLQIMANLISNACKFSPPKKSVTVKSTFMKNNVIISVHNDGPSIPEEFQEKIFAKFTQADTSDSRKKGGTGLGLSITKALVEHMSGCVYFESKEGNGSTFFVEFPIDIK